MMETIIVVVIVAAAIAFGGISLYRALTGKSTGCAGCATTSCPARQRKGMPEAPERPPTCPYADGDEPSA